METSNDQPLVNVYLPERDKEQHTRAIVESNDEVCNMEITSPDWESLTALVLTPAGNYLLTVTHDGAKLEPAKQPGSNQ